MRSPGQPDPVGNTRILQPGFQGIYQDLTHQEIMFFTNPMVLWRRPVRESPAPHFGAAECIDGALQPHAPKISLPFHVALEHSFRASEQAAKFIGNIHH